MPQAADKDRPEFMITRATGGSSVALSDYAFDFIPLVPPPVTNPLTVESGTATMVAAASAVEARPNLHILPDFFEAVGSARRAAGEGTVVVTGSHHTVGDAMNVLGILPYGEE